MRKVNIPALTGCHNRTDLLPDWEYQIWLLVDERVFRHWAQRKAAEAGKRFLTAPE